MQRQFRNLAVALVAGTFALAAGAQDKAPAKPKAGLKQVTDNYDRKR